MVTLKNEILIPKSYLPTRPTILILIQLLIEASKYIIYFYFLISVPILDDQ